MEIRGAFRVFWVFVTTVCLAQTTSATAKSDSDHTQYFAVFVEGRKVGHAIHSRVVSSERVTSSEEMCITIRRMGTPMRIEAKESCVETTAGVPISFRASHKLGAVITRISGRVDKKGGMSITIRALGPPNRLRGTWLPGSLMSEGLRLLKLKKGLKVGAVYDAIMFSPSIYQPVTARICIGPKMKIDLLGRVVTATKITTTTIMPQAGTTVSISYVDENLRLLKHITPFEGIEIEMVACAKEFAMGRIDAVELIDKMFLASPKPLGNLDDVKSITYHLAPTRRVPDLVIPPSDNQKVDQTKDGNVIVTIESVTAPTGVKYPYEGTDETILEAMKSTRFLQSDHAKVIDLAKRAVGETKDAAEAAGKIEAFVADYIENRSLSVGYGSAAEVAAGKQGDCSEFAVLAAAMCRAVGIPAQVVVGVAYVRDFTGQEGFRAHVWMQAHIGDEWIGFDPAFKATGLDGYDVSHIALAVSDGEPRYFFKLEDTLAQFKIEKITVNRE